MKPECNVISMSGGKDSTAAALLAIERDVPDRYFIFADTGHEHEKTYQYLDYLEDALGISIMRVRADFSDRIAHKREVVETKWRNDGIAEEKIQRALAVLQPTGIPMLDLCLWKGRMPSTRARFCSEELKHVPLDREIGKRLDEYNLVWSWQAVRRDESLQRANLIEEEDHPKLQGLTWYRPILDWTAADCFAMHKKYGIEPNPLYKLGMGRVGCMPCIHARKEELRQIGERFPEEIARVAEWERLVTEASKRDATTWFDGRVAAKFLGTSLEAIHPVTHGVHVAAEWAKTDTRSGEIITTDATSCSSLYGLCE